MEVDNLSLGTAHEDLVDLAQRVLLKEAQSKREIGEQLKERYGLILEESALFEVVEELVHMGKAEIRDGRYRKI